MIATAFLHDAYDHKYVSKENETNVKSEITKDLVKFGILEKEVIKILNIIDNISFSKEKKLRGNN